MTMTPTFRTIDVEREPNGFVHVWVGGEIIGELMLRDSKEEGLGVVRLFYLVPELRGTGLSAHLHAYMEDHFRGLARNTVRLNVSPTNTRALGFYLKHGWRDLAPRVGREHVHRMELEL